MTEFEQGMLIGVVMGIVFFGLWITLFPPSNSQSKVWQICDPSTSRCITPSLYLGKDVKEFCPNMNNFTKDVEYSWEGTGTNICPSAGHWECDKWANTSRIYGLGAVFNVYGESAYTADCSESELYEGDLMTCTFWEKNDTTTCEVRTKGCYITLYNDTCTHYIWAK